MEDNAVQKAEEKKEKGLISILVRKEEPDSESNVYCTINYYYYI